MKIGEIISRIGDKDLNSNLIYYWEGLGDYLRPKIVVKKRLRRKEYTERDFKIIEKAWNYYNKQGVRAREALEKAHRDLKGRKMKEIDKELSVLIEKLKEADASVGGMSLLQVVDLVAGESDIELKEDLKKILSKVLSSKKQ